MRRSKAIAVVSALFIGGSFASANAEGCEPLGQGGPVSLPATQQITVRDIIELRDIGPTSNGDARAAIFAISPDQKQIAFQIRQADPDTNGYCLAMVIVPLVPSSQGKVVDSGGELILQSSQTGGFDRFVPYGGPKVITPAWSPNGHEIAYLRQDNGRVQAWVAEVARDSSSGRRVTDLPYDVETVAWSADGKRLIVSGRPGLQDAQVKLDQEARSGFLFDDRFVPVTGGWPFTRSRAEQKYITVDVRSGSVLPVGSSDVPETPRPPTEMTGEAVSLYVANGFGRFAWVASKDSSNEVASKTLFAQSRSR